MNSSTLMRNVLFCCVVVLSLTETIESECATVCLSKEIGRIDDGIQRVEHDAIANHYETREKISEKINAAIAEQKDARELIMELKKEMDETKEEMSTITATLKDILKEKSGNVILIQRHNFTDDAAFKDKKWSHYKEGFGIASEDSAEFWLGLDELHALTRGSDDYTLKIRVKWDEYYDGVADPRRGTYGIAEWDYFRVASEADKFKLTIGRQTRGVNFGLDPFYGNGVRRSKTDINGAAFTTSDEDNDEWGSNCASDWVGDAGGWWYNNCAYIFLNSRSSYALYDGSYYGRPSESTMWIKKIIH